MRNPFINLYNYAQKPKKLLEYFIQSLINICDMYQIVSR